MHNTRKINDSLWWVGANDRRIELFENIYPVPQGVSYNSYVMIDDKCALLDTVDPGFSRALLDNVEYALRGRTLDYLIVDHMEPDHCGTIADIVLRYPDVTIVCTAQAARIMKQLYNFDVDSRLMTVKEGDKLSLGRHMLNFIMAPMVHWPEVMVTYDSTDKILFSADAFGSFGALNGNIFNDEINIEKDWLDEGRRYYTNIVGKYGPQVTALLKKASGLDISMICPLHSVIWRSDLDWLIGKYTKWSSYEPESDSVVLACGSIYGNTANAVDVLAGKLADRGVKDISVYDVSKTDPSYILADVFRCSHAVFASATYNNGIFTPMETLISELAAHNIQNRTFAFIENGSWAPASGKLMRAALESLKNITFLDETVSIRSSLADDQEPALDAMADTIVSGMSL